MLQFLIYFAEYFDIVWWIISYNLFHLYLLKANLLSDDFFFIWRRDQPAPKLDIVYIFCIIVFVLKSVFLDWKLHANEYVFGWFKYLFIYCYAYRITH